MNTVLNKVTLVLKTIFGYGIMLSLFIGGFTFFGYLAALIIGGEVAAKICEFIYEKIYPWLIYGSSVMVLIGLLKMYLCKETALSVTKKNKAK